METPHVSYQQINLQAIEWLLVHNSSDFDDFVRRCKGVSALRLRDMRTGGYVWEDEIPHIAECLRVPPLVITNVTGTSLEDYVLAHRVLEENDDLEDAEAFYELVVERRYAARNTSGTPTTIELVRALYKAFRGGR